MDEKTTFAYETLKNFSVRKRHETTLFLIEHGYLEKEKADILLQMAETFPETFASYPLEFVDHAVEMTMAYEGNLMFYRKRPPLPYFIQELFRQPYKFDPSRQLDLTKTEHTL